MTEFVLIDINKRSVVFIVRIGGLKFCDYVLLGFTGSALGGFEVQKTVSAASRRAFNKAGFERQRSRVYKGREGQAAMAGYQSRTWRHFIVLIMCLYGY